MAAWKTYCLEWHLKIKFCIGIKMNRNPRCLWCMPGLIARGFEKLELSVCGVVV